MTSTDHHTSTPRLRRRRSAVAAVLAGAMGIGVVPLIAAPASANVGEASGASTAVALAPVDAEVAAAIERLRAKGLWVDDRIDPVATAAPSLASIFGRTLFESIVSTGAGVGTNELLRELGYDPDRDLHEALGEVRSAIEDLNAEVRAISEKLEQVLDGQDRANFYDSYTTAGTAATRLSVALASVDGWIAAGAEPTAADVSDMQTIIRTSISDLDFVTTNPTTGVVPLMLRAVQTSDVSDVVGTWADIDLTRDDYRAVLAQGLMSLDLLTRWDTSGTVAADLATLTPITVETVAAMYGYGLAPAGPPGAGTAPDRTFVQVRGSDLALSGWQTGADSKYGDVWRRTTDPNVEPDGALRRGVVEPQLQAMADGYRPDLHGGQTLEQYLSERNIPTRYVFTDSFGHAQVLTGKTVLDKYYDYVTRVVVGEVHNNTYRAVTIELDRRTRAYQEGWSPFGGWGLSSSNRQKKAEAQAWASQLVTAYRSDAAGMTTEWMGKRSTNGTTMGTYQGRMVLGSTTNGVAGFHTDLDPDRIHEAAFGTDAAS